MNLEHFMDKEKQDKSKNDKQDEEKITGGEDSPTQEEQNANEKQTMVALTYDEYDNLEKEIESLQDQIEDH
jgi:hypothetical protein